jgi:transposase
VADGVMRRYMFKVYPNRAQTAALDSMRELCRQLYNAALEQRETQWRHEVQRHAPKERRGLSFYDQGAAIKIIRRDDPAFAVIPFDILSDVLRRLDLAFQAFFRRAKAGAGAASGYPRYRGRKHYPGFGLPKHGAGWRFDHAHNRLYVKGVPGLLRLRGQFPAAPLSIRSSALILRHGTWWLSVAVKMAPRMARENSLSGELSFDLIDSFAALKTASSGHAAGPEERVFTFSNGRITETNPGTYRQAPADPGESSGDRGWTDIYSGNPAPADPGESSGDRGLDSKDQFVRSPADPGESSGDRGKQAEEHARRVPADPGESSGDRGAAPMTPKRSSPADPGESSGDRGSRESGLCSRQPADPGESSGRRRKKRRTSVDARRRQAALHEWTTAIARSYEKLTVSGPASIVETTRSGHGDAVEWGAETALKAALNRYILEQAPASAIAMLKYKIAERGAECVICPPPEHKTSIGNEIVNARKAARRLTRATKKVERSCTRI